ncbi:Mitochondrial inner membrane protease atp23 [Pseudohyphozyma bogoriensis]|nr:Mitochondrial inner membrane protease atp23 [Pseudohyphozyma bogoriensis]
MEYLDTYTPAHSVKRLLRLPDSFGTLEHWTGTPLGQLRGAEYFPPDVYQAELNPSVEAALTELEKYLAPGNERGYFWLVGAQSPNELFFNFQSTSDGVELKFRNLPDYGNATCAVPYFVLTANYGYTRLHFYSVRGDRDRTKRRTWAFEHGSSSYNTDKMRMTVEELAFQWGTRKDVTCRLDGEESYKLSSAGAGIHLLYIADVKSSKPKLMDSFGPTKMTTLHGRVHAVEPSMWRVKVAELEHTPTRVTYAFEGYQASEARPYWTKVNWSVTIQLKNSSVKSVYPSVGQLATAFLFLGGAATGLMPVARELGKRGPMR